MTLTQKDLETPWKCTDPDNNQYGRKISDGVFEFKQGDHHDTISISEYTNDEIEYHINTYGYTLVEPREFESNLRNIKELYGEDWDWIVAECIFEQTINLY